MFTDTRVIHQPGAFAVLAHRHTVAWPDGSSVGLHLVRQGGADAPFLRAVQQDALHWLIFDLRDVTPRSFTADAQALPARDAEGLAMYALRAHHSGAQRFLAAAERAHRLAWYVAENQALCQHEEEGATATWWHLPGFTQKGHQHAAR